MATELVRKITIGGITAYLAILIVSTLIQSPTAPEQGEALYGAWQSFISFFGIAIVLAVPGAVAVLARIVSEL